MKTHPKNLKKEIPIFFATDDNYIKFLAVTLSSLQAFMSDVIYSIYILHSENGISSTNIEKINKYQSSNIKITFCDVSEPLKEIVDKLFTRDYYSKTTYYRLFIPQMFPQYKKAIYLDCDIVLNDDIANLFNIDLGNNLLAAVTDEAVGIVPEFTDFANKYLGIPQVQYFNAGVLLMNLEELRNIKFADKFVDCLTKYKFVVAQDQDYLNVICKDRVVYLPLHYNKMPFINENITSENAKIVHYNLSFKPWHYDDIVYSELFWKYAKQTEYYSDIIVERNNFSSKDIEKDQEVSNNLVKLADKLAKSGLYNKVIK
jgi:lipopolysaccharide biosynthesis glycosyltransferase